MQDSNARYVNYATFATDETQEVHNRTYAT